MGLFDKLKEPVFLKENSDAVKQLDKLKALEPMLNDEGKLRLLQDIKCLEYGIAGENNIAFELKNSHMAMYILHDIYLEDGELSAQIDYLIFTRKLCFVIESKNMIGNIEINNAGDFIRTMEFGGKNKKEGIYSPITQNQRHLELMKKIKVNSKTNFLTKFMAGRYFEDYYKPVVVLANPKTVLNAKFAKKEVKSQVIKADQLVNYIKETYKNSKEPEQSDSELLLWAQSFLSFHIDAEKDYTKKYEQYFLDGSNRGQRDDNETEEIVGVVDIAKSTSAATTNVEDTEIFKELKAYRLHKCREENIKPYFIYNDNQLKDLITKMPTDEDSLKTVSGFGDTKVKKYGKDIMQIVIKYI